MLTNLPDELILKILLLLDFLSIRSARLVSHRLRRIATAPSESLAFSPGSPPIPAIVHWNAVLPKEGALPAGLSCEFRDGIFFADFNPWFDGHREASPGSERRINKQLACTRALIVKANGVSPALLNRVFARTIQNQNLEYLVLRTTERDSLVGPSLIRFICSTHLVQITIDGPYIAHDLFEGSARKRPPFPALKHLYLFPVAGGRVSIASQSLVKLLWDLSKTGAPLETLVCACLPKETLDVYLQDPVAVALTAFPTLRRVSTSAVPSDRWTKARMEGTAEREVLCNIRTELQPLIKLRHHKLQIVAFPHYPKPLHDSDQPASISCAAKPAKPKVVGWGRAPSLRSRLSGSKQLKVFDTQLLDACAVLRAEVMPSIRFVGWLVPRWEPGENHGLTARFGRRGKISESSAQTPGVRPVQVWCKFREDGRWEYVDTESPWPTCDMQRVFGH